ncbi:MAG: sarcosine oxidase subunit gamma family protein [Oceanospirillaceae bacterium]|uniref:sarcosine oxidase subunit gamma n=1 Tax=Marinobacterium litorale TaxID=404770 RepID=UPI0004067DA7|nr:sarcosine oxidase subunit gamma family protein [Marinobacterium litorale]MBS98315.1 sarcosine oxidase subunit gamma family protein [Oceanospirillaceae bacterium]
MSETLAPENEVATVAVMNQLPGRDVRAESPLYHAEMDKLAARNPRAGGVLLRELKLLGHLTLRGSQDNQSFMSGCEAVLGVALPTQPLTSVEKGSVSVRWISPDEWLVVLPGDQAFEVERGLRAAIEGHYSVVNVSGGQTILELSGPNAIDVLKKSTALDVHPSQFPVGKVAGSVFAKSTALVRRSSEDTWELVIRRSFADYLWLWLQDASREYGLVIKS